MLCKKQMKQREMLAGFALAASALIGHVAQAAQAILVEAESFGQLGGWVNDSQFMDQMGSPFLLAHGLGRPVADAETSVKIAEPGKYRVWVRTRDWVAQWTQGKVEAPGQFQVVVNGEPLKTVFGTKGAEWLWQDGGVVEMTKNEASLKLHDLTGFEGRCDAILFSSDLSKSPPDDAPAAWRRALLGLPETPRLAGNFDLVVVGGGIAGMTAAISAGRLGLRVALLHNRPVMGGNASSEAGVGYAGDVCFDPYPNVGLMTREISWSYGNDPKWRFTKAEEAHAYQMKAMDAAGVKLFINYNANQVFTNGAGRLIGVAAQNIVHSDWIRIDGTLFADCTGDGTIGYLAGADFDLSSVVMGRSNLWNINDTGKPVAFPRCPWALDLTDKSFPGRDEPLASPNHRFNGLWGWFWESGFERDQFKESEYIRDNNFRAMYGAFDCLKNVDKRHPNHQLHSAKYISGKRESRRLFGDVILTTQDLKSGKKYEDGCVPCTWDLDVHIANPLFTDKVEHKAGFTEWPFVSDAPMGENTRYSNKPYWMPYRCLYSRNIPNLFMAGRDVSVTHEALGAVRVQPTTGMMGEIVGMAASLCIKHNTEPRGIYKSHLDELKALMDKGTGEKPAVKVMAIEPFDYSGKLDGAGSGIGWKGGWVSTKGSGFKVAEDGNSLPIYSFGIELPLKGSRLMEQSGGNSAERLLDKPFSLAGGQFFVTFLAKRDKGGSFSLEFNNSKKQSRLALHVAQNGAVTPMGATAEKTSEQGLFKPDTVYFVVLRYVHSGGSHGAVASVKLFEAGKERVPRSLRTLAWDVATPGASTGAGQDRLVLSVPSGSVEIDEIRMGASWESVLVRMN